ncbi:MAG: ABC transporter permease [Deltaproteobacteria bacterium]|nr:ABC transporter permease [Deltaproteobacteria bacterium]
MEAVAMITERVGKLFGWRTNVLPLFRRFPLLVCGIAVLVVVTVAAIAAPLLSPYDPLGVDLSAMLEPPNTRHLLGTDDLGRDLLSRIIYGGRISLSVSVGSVSISLGVGLLIGLITGYWGGWIDTVLMRLMDAILAFPSLVLALAIAAALGAKLVNTAIAIGIVYIPQFARLARGQVLAVRGLEYIQASRGLGASNTRIILSHILPNIAMPLIVQVTLSLGYAILAEAALSFLGVGVQPPQAAWGTMLRMGYPYLDTAPWLAIVPGAAIFVVVMAFTFVGDGIGNLLGGGSRR